MDFVLDCSATMPWILANDESGYTDDVLNALAGSTAVVPAIWPLEVANVLLVFERKQHISSRHSTTFMHALVQLPITAESTPQGRIFGRIYELGEEYSLSAYDAAYLEVCLRHEIPLATLNNRLRHAVSASGAGIFGSP